MLSHLGQSVIRGWGKLRERVTRFVFPEEERREDPRPTGERARFWAGVREGQREAETRCAARDAR
jgi:hypothetical protein